MQVSGQLVFVNHGKYVPKKGPKVGVYRKGGMYHTSSWSLLGLPNRMDRMDRASRYRRFRMKMVWTGKWSGPYQTQHGGD